ncbi:MAG: hypothetical protein FWD88_02075 [Treponema sp.]|nr:hypothetical protein [Treponema sp.]
MAIAATLDQTPSTPEKVWATLDRITQKQEESERRWAEFDRRWEEFDRRRELEAEQRQAESVKQQAEAAKRQAEAAKRQAEAAKRRAELEQEVAKRRAEAAKRRAELEQEAAKRRAELEQEAAKRRAELEQEAAKRRAELEQEAAKRQEKLDLEAARRQEEFDRKWEKLERLVKHGGKRMGELNNSFGELVEHLVAPGIARRFGDFGLNFGPAVPGPTITNKTGEKIVTQVDLVLENEDTVVAVEVKARVKSKHIKHHARRIEILKEHRRAKGLEPKRILGAIAGAIYPPILKAETLSDGFFVIEQSGDTLQLDVPEGFVPREW